MAENPMKSVVVTTTNDATTRHLRKVNVLASPVAGTSLPSWLTVTADGHNTHETVVSVSPTVPGLKTVVGATGGGGGGGGPTPHRYWRINITAKSANEAGLVHCEFAELGGTAHTPSTASASTEFDAARNAAKAIDGSAATEWAASTTSVPQYLTIDYGSAVNVEVVRIIHRLAGAYPTAFDVQYSDDGSSFTTAWSISGLDLTGYDQTTIANKYPFSNATATVGGKPLWRINVTTTEGGSNLSLTELEFRAALGGADLTAPSGHFWHKMFGFALPATGAFDDNTGTIFHTASGQDGILGYEFDDSKEVLQVAILPRASGPSQGPKNFTVEYSADGKTWTTAQTFTNTTGWAAGVTKTFNI